MEKVIKKILKKIDLESDFQRSEWIGDSIYNTIVSDYIYERFSEKREGFLSKLRSKLINNVIMKDFCTDLGWNKYNIKNKNLADLFEAIIGVFFKLKGYKKTKKFIVESLLDSKIKWIEILISL